jgi:hypothetical protein
MINIHKKLVENWKSKMLLGSWWTGVWCTQQWIRENTTDD